MPFKKILAVGFSILGIAAAVHATTPKDFEQTLEYMSAEEMRTLLKTLEGTEDGLLLARKIQEIEVDENPTWKCPTCNPNEQYVLKELQEKEENLRQRKLLPQRNQLLQKQLW